MGWGARAHYSAVGRTSYDCWYIPDAYRDNLNHTVVYEVDGARLKHMSPVRSFATQPCPVSFVTVFVLLAHLDRCD